MSGDLDDYKYRGLSGVSWINYARFFFDALKSDQRYSGLIADAKIPGIGGIRKAGASSAVGAALAATVGIGWWKGTGGAILLKDCPIQLITIGEHDRWARIRCFFPVPEAKYGNAAISGKLKGWFSNRRAVDLELEGHAVPGFEDIKKDQKLLDDILSLFQSRLCPAFEELAKPKILIKFERKEGNQYGIVEYGVQRYSRAVEKCEKMFGVSYLQVTRGLFDVANDLASYIKKACTHAR